MKIKTYEHFNKLFVDLPALSVCKSSIEQAFDILKACYDKSGKLLLCGNGGSAADSEHIVGELMKGFLLKRKIKEEHREILLSSLGEEGRNIADKLQGALPAISLVSQSALNTAFINDVDAKLVYAQQVYGYGKKGDVLVGISTSGNSDNVVNAFKVAKAFGIKTIGMAGNSGGKMKDICDIAICVPSDITYKIQEYHLPVYHTLCAMLEAEFFDE
jgi:phosphoheptose isomerase